MTDAELLLLILLGIYLVDCATWVPRDAVAFVAPWLLRWRVTFAGALIGNDQGGAVLGNPLPPLGYKLVCQSWPIAISPEGVLGWTSEHLAPGTRRAAQNLPYRTWSDMRAVSAQGRELWINNQRFATTVSAQLTRRLAQLLESLRNETSPERRAAAIDAALAESYDAQAAGQRLSAMRRETWPLVFSCNLLLLYVGVGGALLVWTTDFWRRWPYLLAGLLILWLGNVLQYFLAHRALEPQERGARWKHALMMLVSPPAAARAHDALSVRLLSTFHPLAVAAATLKPERLRPLAQQILCDTLHPGVLPEALADEPARQTEAWFRERRLECVIRLVADTGLIADELMSAPIPEHEECLGYCPRCRSQYTIAEGMCEPCGVALRSLVDGATP